MPRFYFDIANGPRSFRDDEGSDHDNAESARLELVGAVADLARNEIREHGVGDIRGAMKDADGKVPFEATVSVRSGWVD